MSVITSTGTKLSVVASAPATFNKAGFELLSFEEVGEITDYGEYGPTVQVVEHNPLATGITEKYKGFINYGSLSIGLAWDVSDDGQYILSEGVTGATKNDPHSVMIEYQDGSVDYFVCGIFSYTKNPSSANNMVGSSVQVEINSPVLNVPTAVSGA